MNKGTTRTLVCPACGKAFECQVVEVLEPGDENVEQLFRGKLNQQRCPQCGRDFLAESTLIYKDSEEPYLLFLEQFPEDGDIERIEQEIDELATQISNEGNVERPQIRLVFGRPEFIEKIAIRQRGFDDRLIEYAKLQLYRNTEEMQLSRNQHRLYFDYTNTNDDIISFLVFDRNTARPVNMIHVPMDEFHSVELALKANPEALAELMAAFPGYYVSADRLL